MTIMTNSISLPKYSPENIPVPFTSPHLLVPHPMQHFAMAPRGKNDREAHSQLHDRSTWGTNETKI